MAGSKSSQAGRSGTILVTGGCGFIGVNLVRYLADRGCRIRILDNLSVGKKEYLRQLQSKDRQSFTDNLVVGDIRDREMVGQAVRDVVAVVHLAAHTSVIDSLKNPREAWEVNVAGTLNVLEACRQNGVARFVFASSNAVVGEQPPPIDELKIPQPLSPYGAAKLAGEALCSSYYHSFGLETISLRFANCYGPFSEHKPSVIPIFLDRARQGKSITIYGDGNQTRDFINVGDVCQAIHLALTTDLDSYGEVFQVATGTETSINQLVKLIQEATGGKFQIIYEAERKGEIKRNYSGIAKARRMLGFDPVIKLGEGLKELWRLKAAK